MTKFKIFPPDACKQTPQLPMDKAMFDSCFRSRPAATPAASSNAEERPMELARILLVDDDKNVLEGYKRILHGLFEVETATNGSQALAAVHLFGPYEVIITDMQMPGMNGAEFLTKVRQLSPNSVRMVLTGHKNINRAIDAVNEGRIFRYLTKPCEKKELVHAIELASAQYRANIDEKELVKQAREIKPQAYNLGEGLLSHNLKQ
jgi:DNA-binding NtrC family response regulator